MAAAKPKLTAAALNAIIQGNPGVWFEGFTKIKGTNGKLVKPRMNILQRRVNAFFMARRAKGMACRGIGLKPRKRGFSTIVGAIHYTELAKYSFEACIVGNKLETSDTVFRMMKGYYENDDLAKSGDWGSAAKWTTEKATWQHGSILSQSTAMNGQSIRGQTPQCIHCTEAAHWGNDEEVLLALLNAVPDDPNTSIFIESTPNGIGNAFAKRWDSSRWPTPDECPDGKQYWKYWEADCPDNPDAVMSDFEFVRIFAAWFEFEESAVRLTAEQKQHIKNTMDECSWYVGERELIAKYGNIRESDGAQRLGLEVTNSDVWEQLAWRRATIKNKCGSDPKKYDQEFPADPKSCFLASGNPVFDTDAIADYVAGARGVVPDYGAINLNKNDRATWQPVENDSAIFHRWEEPKKGCRYLIVVDSAEGDDQTKGEDPDRHSVLVLRAAYRDAAGTIWKPRVVARVAPPCRVPIHSIVNYVKRLHLYYGRAIVLPEMNNSGLAFIVGAQHENITIWKRQEFNPRSGKEEEKFGWRTTDSADYGGVRTLIIDHLGKLLRDRDLHLTCTHAIHELGVFVEKDGKKQAPKGEHDDDVLALAIGLYNLDAASLYEEPVVEFMLPRDLSMLERAGGGGNNLLAMTS